MPNTVYTYDATGNLHTETLPDGIVQTYSYDTLNRLTSETVTEGANNIASFTYSLSTDGQRTQEADNQYNTSGTLLYTNTFNWGYDGDNRLTSETLTAGTGSPDSSYTDTYTYDSVGNRLTKTHVVGTNTLSVTDAYDSNGDDRLLTETATGTGAYSSTFTYDNNGSLTSETRTGAGATTNNYTYDVQNHLVTAVIGNTTTNYAYDADGNRVSSTQGATTTYYVIDDVNPTDYTQILEQATSFGGTPGTTYVSGSAVLGQANSSGPLLYLVTDGHGSTRILADASGAINSRYDFDAFGNTLATSSGTQILYVGQFLDTTTGLYDLRARNYDPSTGRFTSFDTFSGYITDPSSLNKFTYSGANPLNNVDPSGHQFIDLVFSLGGDIGEALGEGFFTRFAVGGLSNLAFNFAIAEVTNQQYGFKAGAYDFLTGGFLSGISGGFFKPIQKALGEAGFGSIISFIGGDLGAAFVGALGDTAVAIGKAEQFNKPITVKGIFATFGFALLGNALGGAAGQKLEEALPESVKQSAEGFLKDYKEFTSLQASQAAGEEALQTTTGLITKSIPFVESVADYIIKNGKQVGGALAEGGSSGIEILSDLLKETVVGEESGGEGKGSE